MRKDKIVIREAQNLHNSQGDNSTEPFANAHDATWWIELNYTRKELEFLARVAWLAILEADSARDYEGYAMSLNLYVHDALPDEEIIQLAEELRARKVRIGGEESATNSSL